MLDTVAARGQRYAMAGKPQHTNPRVKVSLNLDAQDLLCIEDLAHRMKREENLPRKWGKGNLMEVWIKEGLQRTLDAQKRLSPKRKETEPVPSDDSSL